MDVILARTCGFCFGVKRAVDTVYEELKRTDRLYTFGEIVNNEEVVSDLAEKGVSVIHSAEELKKIKDATVIIRAHGVSKSVYELVEKQGLRLVDATCPFVKRIHQIVDKESAEGKQIVIIGDAKHPEVIGIAGWCRQEAIIIESEKEAEELSLSESENLCIVSQTTFNYNKFQDIVEIIEKKGYNVNVANTICNATEDRQREAKEIASAVDVMIVIGGRHSSNTRKLYEICSKECANTYFIQTLDDLHLELTDSVQVVGITAGASTPNYIIEEVQNYVRINF